MVNRLNLRIALLSLLLAAAGISSAADDLVNKIVADLKQRAKSDVPTLAEYDILCTYGSEKWTIHSVSFMARQSPSPTYAMKGEAPDRLKVLFPTYTFMAIGACLDPLSLEIMLDRASPRLLPPEKLEGLECQVLELDSLPRADHLGADYQLPALQNAAVRLYIHEERIKRVVAVVQRRPLAGELNQPLTAEYSAHYRRPKVGTKRQPAGDPLARFELPDDGGAGLADIAWSPDGRSIACQTFRHGLKLFSADNAREIRTIPTPGSVSQIRFTPDNRYLVVQDGQDGFLYYRDVVTGQEVKSVSMRGSLELTLSPNAATAAAWDNQANLRVVDCFTGRTLCNLQATKTRDVQFNTDGTQLAVLIGNRLVVKDTATGRDLHSFRSKCEQSGEFGQTGTWRMAFSPDSRFVAIGDGNRGLSLYNLLDKPERAREPASVYVYELETGRLVQTLSGLHGSVSVMRFSPDGNILAVGEADDRGEVLGDNAAVMLWETKHWQSLGAAAVQSQSAIIRMEFAPNSKRIATVAEHSPSVEIWQLPVPSPRTQER